MTPDNPRKKYITVDPEEDSITEDSKKTLSLKALKRILSTVAFDKQETGKC